MNLLIFRQTEDVMWLTGACSTNLTLENWTITVSPLSQGPRKRLRPSAPDGMAWAIEAVGEVISSIPSVQ